jgi:hypothetical protein
MTDAPTVIPAARPDPVVPYATSAAIEPESAPEVTRAVLWSGLILALIQLAGHANGYVFAAFLSVPTDAWYRAGWIVAAGGAIALLALSVAALRHWITTITFRRGVAILLIVLLASNGAWFVRALNESAQRNIGVHHVVSIVHSTTVLITMQFWLGAMVWCLRGRPADRPGVTSIGDLCRVAAVFGAVRSVDQLSRLMYAWPDVLDRLHSMARSWRDFTSLLELGCVPAAAVVCAVAARQVRRRRILITLAALLMLGPQLASSAIHHWQILTLGGAYEYPPAVVVISAVHGFCVWSFAMLAVTLFIWPRTAFPLARSARSANQPTPVTHRRAAGE